MDPCTSANSTVRCFRSPAPSQGTATGEPETGAGAGPTATPHRPQNRAPGGVMAAQAGQDPASSTPQSMQNR